MDIDDAESARGNTEGLVLSDDGMKGDVIGGKEDTEAVESTKRKHTRH